MEASAIIKKSSLDQESQRKAVRDYVRDHPGIKKFQVWQFFKQLNFAPIILLLIDSRKELDLRGNKAAAQRP